MDRTAVERWLTAYIEAWKSNDPQVIGDLPAEDATYSPFLWTGAWSGRTDIVDGWLGHREWERSWTFRHEIVAVDGDTAVIHGETHYDATTTEPEANFSNIWIARFDAEPRAREFREWCGGKAALR